MALTPTLSQEERIPTIRTITVDSTMPYLEPNKDYRTDSLRHDADFAEHEIHVDTAPNRGTCFRVELPIVG